MFTPQLVRNRQSPRLYAALDAVAAPWPGHDGDGRPPPEPGPSSVVVSQDRSRAGRHKP